MPDAKQHDPNDVTFESTNLNNYSLLMRFKQDIGAVGHHIPYVIPLRYLNQCATSLSKKTFDMIGKYCVSYYNMVRVYNGDYWNLRYKNMALKSHEARRRAKLKNQVQFNDDFRNQDL